MAPSSSRATRSQSSNSVDSTSDHESTSSNSTPATEVRKKASPHFKLLELNDEEFNLTQRLTNQSFYSLNRKLNDSNIEFSASTNKNFLLGAAILFDLDIIKRDQAPNEEFAIQVGKWAQLDVPKMQAAVEGLDIQGVKSKAPQKDMLKFLIQHMIAEGDPHWLYSEEEVASAAERESTRVENQANEKALQRVRYELDIEIDYELKGISHEVINLSIATVGYQIKKSKGFSSCPGCPKSQYTTVLKILKDIPVLKSHADLTKRLTQAPASPSKTILNWICDWFGTEFAIVPKDELIPGFPAGVHQFFVQGNAQRLLEKFYGYYEDAGEKSQLVFYGTPIRNLRGIVYTGFDPEKEFTTDPRIAVTHAMKDMIRKFGEPTTTDGEMRPYPKSIYGAVLACEYVHGLETPGEEKVFNETGLGRVLGRYVFLVPNDVELDEIPTGKDIEKALLEGFKRQRDGEWGEDEGEN